MSDFTILGLGTSVPQHAIDRKESVKIVVDHFCPTEKEKRIVPVLYRMAGVQRRHSVLLEGPADESDEGARRLKLMHFPKNAQDMGPTVGQRMEEYEREAFQLACRASEEALETSGVSANDITHLVTVSCSGFVAPGVDIRLMKLLGLPATVERAHIGFMGCQGALNGLRVAEGFSRGRPDATILLCAVELCSIHYHYGWNPEQVVANALFADGAAALVGALREDDGWRIKASGACLIPDSEDAMTWRIRDNGFIMSLSSKVPGLIETHLRVWLEEWLEANGFQLDDIATWAVHPGGPRILSSVQKALDLPVEALEVSRDTLKNYGNMSSPTILFILNQLRAQSAPTPCVAMAFGPGLMVETVLLC